MNERISEERLQQIMEVYEAGTDLPAIPDTGAEYLVESIPALIAEIRAERERSAELEQKMASIEERLKNRIRKYEALRADAQPYAVEGFEGQTMHRVYSHVGQELLHHLRLLLGYEEIKLVDVLREREQA